MHHIKFLAAAVYGNVKGHNRSLVVQLVKPCEHDISRRETLIVFISSMWMSRIGKKILFDVVKGQISFGFIRD